MGGGLAPDSNTKTVVILGGAYGGTRAAQVLAQGLPASWRIVLIDRNSHTHHVYAMPRFSVLPGHEFKAFIPYTNVFKTPAGPNHIVLQAHIISMRPHHITLSKAFPEYGFSNEVPFDFAVYALGSRLPSPLDLWGTTPHGTPVTLPTRLRELVVPLPSTVYTGDKVQGCQWLLEKQKIIETAPTILVVGGGALGVQYATDIKAVYPTKDITLLHSRLQLLNRFDVKMHDESLKVCQEQDINVILGERLDMSSVGDLGAGNIIPLGKKIVRTITGREIAADLLILCTGQTPNTSILQAMDSSVINEENRRVNVLRTLQINPVHVSCGPNGQKVLPNRERGATPYPYIFAIGDAADAFGAIMAGHTAYYQGEVAARNIVRLVKRREAEEKFKSSVMTGVEDEDSEALMDDPLESYTPGLPAIKVSLGMTHSVSQLGEEVSTKDDGVPDMQVKSIWKLMGVTVNSDEDMRA
ncbi:hypothetical protein CPB83DRAFT_850293 [Crepidotus variabilis]|uniref:FAD/NAD(P)-binding domain-containing protein n=1 Tax=Crepidotus variabilis TaxID=179855 RepID=A0A9P6JSC2_9AGAR|nr:hypothetical protein CPB83DRAFT_850293 [Crepidotus variabilis]